MNDLRFCPRCAAPLVTRHEEGRERRACAAEACGFTFWGNPTPAVGALVELDGDIILARNKAWPEGHFALITGFLEAREDPRQAVVREVREELGLDVFETHLIGNYIFEAKNEVMLCYHALARGTIELGAELADYRRVPPHRLRPWKRATGFAVADWMRARGLAFEWIERPPPTPQPAKA